MALLRHRRIMGPSFPYVSTPAVVGGGGGSPTWTPTLNSTEQTAGANPVTFVAAALGATNATRITVVLAHCEATGQTGMTIGGLTATEAVHEFTAISGLGIWYCDTHALGTTADIVVSAAGSMTFNTIQVGQLINCTATPTFTNNVPSANSPTAIAVTVPVGSIGLIGIATNGATAPTSWTNATEDYTFTASDGMIRALAHATASATVNYTFAGGGAVDHMVAAVWGA